MNSCNPVFVTVGLRMGADTFYQSMKQFGLLNRTGIDVPGEAGTIMHAQDQIGPVKRATISFGLGGIQYTSITQKDADGNKIGSRKASNMRFRLNIAAINFGMTIHLWDKKKQ